MVLVAGVAILSRVYRPKGTRSRPFHAALSGKFGFMRPGMLALGPTHHSTGPALKAAQAGELKR